MGLLTSYISRKRHYKCPYGRRCFPRSEICSERGGVRSVLGGTIYSARCSTPPSSTLEVPHGIIISRGAAAWQPYGIGIRSGEAGMGGVTESLVAYTLKTTSLSARRIIPSLILDLPQQYADQYYAAGHQRLERVPDQAKSLQLEPAALESA